MHEFGLCQGLMDIVDQRAAGRRVAAVRLRVGARHAVVDEAFAQAFAMVAQGTVAAEAEVDVVIMPMSVHCRSCQHQSESTDPLAGCAQCGGDDVDRDRGDELMVEWIEYAPAREEATADVLGNSR